jgi:anti-sigma factor (TIGR02949 family)
MTCADFEKFVSAYVDGELDAPAMTDFERHLAGCSRCSETARAERTVKEVVHSTMRGVSAPAGLRARIHDSLDRAGSAEANRSRPFGTWIAPALAAAAALLFWVQPAWLSSRMPGSDRSDVRGAALFDTVADLHARDLPVEVQGNPEDVRGWFQHKVQFPVQPPRPRLAGRRVTLVGARLSHVRGREAAQLVYDIDGRRVLVVVYEPDREGPLEGRPRRVAGREVVLGRAHGYHVAVVERGGLRYVLSTDLGESETVRLASQVVP